MYSLKASVSLTHDNTMCTLLTQHMVDEYCTYIDSTYTFTVFKHVLCLGFSSCAPLPWGPLFLSRSSRWLVHLLLWDWTQVLIAKVITFPTQMRKGLMSVLSPSFSSCPLVSIRNAEHPLLLSYCYYSPLLTPSPCNNRSLTIRAST